MRMTKKTANIGEVFLNRCNLEGKKIGYKTKKNGEWKDVTFAEHLNTVRLLSCGLMSLDLKPGETMNILGQTSLYWSQLDMAILGAGAITVPIYPTNTPEDTKYIINHCEARFLFIDDYKNLQKIATITKECPKLEKIFVNFEVKASDFPHAPEIIQWSALYDLGLNKEKAYATKFEQNLTEAKPSDIFTICYTSGTTGLPKGVVLTHEAMISVMTDVDIFMEGHVNDHEILLSFLPMSHIFGKWESMTPYFFGWTSAFAESLDSLVENLSEIQPTLWIAVPRIFEKIYSKVMSQVEDASPVKKKLFQWALSVGKQVVDAQSAGKRAPLHITAQYEVAKKLVFSKVAEKFGGNLKFCVSGSAPLAKNIQEFMTIVGIPVYEGYGLTETCAPVCVNTPSSNRFGTVGKIFPEVLLKIAEDGEILIKSAKNFTGYYKDPKATAEALREGWFYTGDIGHIDEDGFLAITDRKKDLIKTAGGKYIAPQKIENIAKSEKIISQVVLYGDQKPFAVALITLNQETVIQFAQSRNMIYDDYPGLLKNQEITSQVEKAMVGINAQLAKYETIKKYIVLPREFTVEAGELTPSLKVKRKFLCSKYHKELESLYGDGGAE